MPVWIRLPNLPLHFWSPGSINRIASIVGKPLFLDDKSVNGEKLQFARVYVDVSARNPLPKFVSIEIEGEVGCCYDQTIEYETSLKSCTKCVDFGHTDETCEETLRIKTTLHKRRYSKSKVTSTSLSDKWKKIVSSTSQDAAGTSSTKKDDTGTSSV